MEPFTLALAVAALVVAGLLAAAAPYVVREFAPRRAAAPLYDRPVCSKSLDRDDLFDPFDD